MIKINIAKKNDLNKNVILRFLAQKYTADFDKDVIISKKTKQDLARLTKQEFKDPRITYLLVTKKNNPIGFAILSVAPEIDNTAFIGELFIKTKYRHQGIGRQLIKKTTELVTKKGIKNLRVTVALKNKSAQKFYKKFGFSIKKRDYLLMEKPLN